MFVEGLNKQLLHQRYQQGMKKTKRKPQGYEVAIPVVDTVEISSEARRLFNESQKQHS